MFEMKKRRLSFSIGLLLAAVLLPFGTATMAHAAISGPKILSAAGGTIDTAGDPGYLVLGGFVTLNDHGGARSLDVTITYEDQYPEDAFTCTLTTPSDLTYSISKGIGTLTLTVGSGEVCNAYALYDNLGNGITFQIYAVGSKVKMVSTGSTLNDSNDDTVDPFGVSGAMAASGTGGRQAQGKRLLVGSGDAVDANLSSNANLGYMALAGKLLLNSLQPNETSESAKHLDVTLSFGDTDSDTLSCRFTDPADVSYSLKKGVGTLTLTVGAGECSTANDGNSISFNLYAAGAKGLIVSTGSTLVDSNGDTIVPAVVADFSSPGGSR
jgi:hypothetical protein